MKLIFCNGNFYLLDDQDKAFLLPKEDILVLLPEQYTFVPVQDIMFFLALKDSVVYVPPDNVELLMSAYELLSKMIDEINSLPLSSNFIQ